MKNFFFFFFLKLGQLFALGVTREIGKKKRVSLPFKIYKKRSRLYFRAKVQGQRSLDCLF